MKNNIFKFLFAVIFCQLAGIVGSIFTFPAIKGWYATLQKPSFSPPNWIFSPVWITLFFLMGISLYLILKKDIRDKEVKKGLLVFVIQLLLNIKWSFLFFYMHNPFYAFLDILFLWLAIVLTIIQFRKIDRGAAYLLLPYLTWVTFAALLNFSIWQLNI
ncbi:MAG: TspO/MBR family protein [Candidatus Paceibacterota bacterium]